MVKRKQQERVMIDTHIYLHYANNPSYLSDYAREVMDDPNIEVCMSAESIRELVVAYNSRNISSRKWQCAADVIDDVVNLYGITILPITQQVVFRYANLYINEAQHHNDPSDHIIICHAIEERIPLISADGKFDFYIDQGLDLILDE